MGFIFTISPPSFYRWENEAQNRLSALPKFTREIVNLVCNFQMSVYFGFNGSVVPYSGFFEQLSLVSYLSILLLVGKFLIKAQILLNSSNT